jgi:hypothetical protein
LVTGFSKKFYYENFIKLQIKILIVCFACLAMSAIYQLVMQPSLTLFNNSPYIVQRVALWVYNFSYWLGFCTEEICLCLLVRDFRKFLKEQFGAIFPSCGKSEVDNQHGYIGHTTVTPTTSLQTQQRQTTNGVFVRSNIGPVNGTYNPHQQQHRK